MASLSDKIINNIHQPDFVYRDTKHDFPKKVTEDKNSIPKLCTRLAAVALPFFSLHRPFGLAFTFVGNSLRVITTSSEFGKAIKDKEATAIATTFIHTAIAIATLAFMVISPAISMAITTIHDLGYHLGHLYEELKKEHPNRQKIFECFLRILASSVYLTLFFATSLELTVFSFSVQILLGLYLSSDEFKRGNLLEGTGHLVMSALRINQMRPQVQMLQFKWELQKALANLPEENFVGELGENWEFSSDHLPIGATVNGKHIGSWNVLDTEYIDWVTDKNSQGINGGMISRLNRESSVMKGMTVREVLVIHQILMMVERPNQPFKILALQECNTKFIQALECMLPSHIHLVLQNRGLQDQEILLYNANDFNLLSNESVMCVKSAFPSAPRKYLMDVVLQDKISGEKFQIINTHIPGDPALPCRFEFAEYVVTHKRDDAVTIALGDMNFTPRQMEEAFSQAVNKHRPFLSISNEVKYYTNIDPYTKAAKNIDQMWISPKDDTELKVVVDDPDQVLPGLQRIVNQLLPNSKKLEELYIGEVFDPIKFMSMRWRLYLDRLKKWEEMQQSANLNG